MQFLPDARRDAHLTFRNSAGYGDANNVAERSDGAIVITHETAAQITCAVTRRPTGSLGTFESHMRSIRSSGVMVPIAQSRDAQIHKVYDCRGPE